MVLDRCTAWPTGLWPPRIEGLGVLLDLVPAGISMLKVGWREATIEINRYAARLFGQSDQEGLHELSAQYRMLANGRDRGARGICVCSLYPHNVRKYQRVLIDQMDVLRWPPSPIRQMR